MLSPPRRRERSEHSEVSGNPSYQLTDSPEGVCLPLHTTCNNVTDIHTSELKNNYKKEGQILSNDILIKFEASARTAHLGAEVEAMQRDDDRAEGRPQHTPRGILGDIEFLDLDDSPEELEQQAAGRNRIEETWLSPSTSCTLLLAFCME